MSLRRVAVLLRKDFAYTSGNFLFFFAIGAPFLISLILSLVFGTLFSEKPKLGIADLAAAGSKHSRLGQVARELDAVTVKEYAGDEELKEAVEVGVVDMGVLLPQGFDTSVAEGSSIVISAYIWGESLAQNRVILGGALSDAILTLAGRKAPVEIASTTLGDAESAPWNERLLPLVVLIAMFYGGIMIPATSLVDEKHKHTLLALTTTPTTLEEVVASKGLIGVGISLVVGMLTLALNGALGARQGLLVLVMALGAVMAAFIGLLLGLLVKDIHSLFATIKSMGLFLYAPALLHLFPQVPPWIGRLFPTYYLLQPVVDISLRGARWGDVAVELFVLIGIIVALFVAVVWVERQARVKLAS